jgi:hypothetical protein
VNGSLLKLSALRLLIRLAQVVRRPVRRQAGLYDSDLHAVFTAEGPSPASARAALADRVAEALIRMADRPILVIGGGRTTRRVST